MRASPAAAVLVVLLALAGQAAATDEVRYAAEVKDAEAEVRSAPGTSDPVYPTNRLPKGTIVQVVDELPDGWLKIRPPHGSFSFINTRFLDHLAGSNWAVVSPPDVRVPVFVGSDLKPNDRGALQGCTLPRGAQVVAARRPSSDPRRRLLAAHRAASRRISLHSRHGRAQGGRDPGNRGWRSGAGCEGRCGRPGSCRSGSTGPDGCPRCACARDGRHQPDRAHDRRQQGGPRGSLPRSDYQVSPIPGPRSANGSQGRARDHPGYQPSPLPRTAIGRCATRASSSGPCLRPPQRILRESPHNLPRRSSPRTTFCPAVRACFSGLVARLTM